MKERLKKDIKSIIVLLSVGAVIGLVWALLGRFGVLEPPGEAVEAEMWVVGVVIGVGVILFVVPTIILEMLKKRDKKYEIEEKDERNVMLRGKASNAACAVNIGAISGLCTTLFLMGNSKPALLLMFLGVINIVSWVVAFVFFNKKM
ncbi:MAG: hypothetical protein FWH20_08795 [Oscillospiraceae bacterium]|nr:hypothetical protein [Oscillospiraceae bacterium]